MLEMDLDLPWRRPIPAVFWFDKRLRVWLSAQDKPAPLAIVIRVRKRRHTAKLATLRSVLYGRDITCSPCRRPPSRFHRVHLEHGRGGDLLRRQDLYAAIGIIAHCAQGKNYRHRRLGYSLAARNAAIVKAIDAKEHKLNITGQ